MRKESDVLEANISSASEQRKVLPAANADGIWDLNDLIDIEGHNPAASRNEFTYGSIKRMILSGKFWPGRKLVHNDLAASLNVSRTPVREALERLYQEGFVTRLPRRGFYVAEITKEEAIDLYGAREALETYALEQTLARGPVTPDTIAELSTYLDRYNKLLKDAILKERILVDVRFHLRLADLSGNRHLVRLLAQTFERLTLKRRLEASHPERRNQSASEHRDLLEAIARHKQKRALQVLRNHIQHARDAVVSYLHEFS